MPSSFIAAEKCPLNSEPPSVITLCGEQIVIMRSWNANFTWVDVAADSFSTTAYLENTSTIHTAKWQPSSASVRWSRSNTHTCPAAVA